MKQWQGISEFVAVAEHQSFTKAAEWLGMSVAQVSRNVSELERRLKIRLFYRSTRQVRLSEEGQLYLQHCQHLVQGLDDANRALGNLQQVPQGQLRITAPVYYGETIIAPLLNDFLLTHPEVTLDLVLTNARLDLIEGRFDLAIRLGQLESSQMVARKLGNRRHFVVASPAYLERYDTPQSLDDLKLHQKLAGTLEQWRFRIDNSKDITVKPSSQWRCNSGVALLDAVRKGMGLAQLPDYYVQQDIDEGRLVPVLDQYRPSDDGIWALYPQNRHLSPKVRALVEYLTHHL